MLCKKCNQPLTDIHLLEGCKYNAKFRISRHNNMFKLLHDLLQTHNGGIWPTLSMDLGNKPEWTFETNVHRNNHHTRRPHITIHRSHTRKTLKRQSKFKTSHHRTQHNSPKRQKTKAPQTGHHKSHRLHHKLTGLPSRKHHIQRTYGILWHSVNTPHKTTCRIS